MSDIAIRVENLGKRFRLGHPQTKHDTLRDALASGVRDFVQSLGLQMGGHGNGKHADEMIWALQDISFEVRQGEVVGIIGSNGAGKSTLLKILSSITEPTTGCAAIYGRIGSLLEVGTGFHSELTGRENIYLSGAILGMKRAEIDKNFEAIVDFAEVEKFIDTPVKRYSSGMYLRLAFAVAAHLEPEILLVDEVLAVGDAAFQKKCLGKMGDVAKQGRTVLFVSHNMVAIGSLCERVIWLKDGQIAEQGVPNQVVSNYLRAFVSSTTERHWDNIDMAPGCDSVRVRRACVHPVGSSSSDLITVHTPLVIEFEYWNLDPNHPLIPSLQLYNDQGTLVFNVGPVDQHRWQKNRRPVGLYREVCRVPGNLLNEGMHRIGFCISKGDEVIFHNDEILAFDVMDSDAMRGSWYGKWPGAIRPVLEWDTEFVDEK